MRGERDVMSFYLVRTLQQGNIYKLGRWPTPSSIHLVFSSWAFRAMGDKCLLSKPPLPVVDKVDLGFVGVLCFLPSWQLQFSARVCRSQPAFSSLPIRSPCPKLAPPLLFPPADWTLIPEVFLSRSQAILSKCWNLQVQLPVQLFFWHGLHVLRSECLCPPRFRPMFRPNTLSCYWMAFGW